MVKLSHRETEILLLIGKGYTDKEIACLLNISKKTVQTHLSRIFLKLNAKNRTSAVCRYLSLKHNLYFT